MLERVRNSKQVRNFILCLMIATFGSFSNLATAEVEGDHDSQQEKSTDDSKTTEAAKKTAPEAKSLQSPTSPRISALEDMKDEIKKLNDDSLSVFANRIATAENLTPEVFKLMVDTLPGDDNDPTKKSLLEAFEKNQEALGENILGQLALATAQVLADRRTEEEKKEDERLAEAQKKLDSKVDETNGEGEDEKQNLKEQIEALLAEKEAEVDEDEVEENTEAQEALAEAQQRLAELSDLEEQLGNQSLQEDPNQDLQNALDDALANAEDAGQEDQSLADSGAGSGAGDSGAGSGSGSGSGSDSGAGSDSGSPLDDALKSLDDNKPAEKNFDQLSKAFESDSDESSDDSDENDFSLDSSSSDEEDEIEAEVDEAESLADTIPGEAGVTDVAEAATAPIIPSVAGVGGESNTPDRIPTGATGSFNGSVLGGGTITAPQINSASSPPLSNGDGNPFLGLGEGVGGASSSSRGGFTYVRTSDRDFGQSSGGSQDGYGGNTDGGDDSEYAFPKVGPRGQITLPQSGRTTSSRGVATSDGSNVRPGVFSRSPLQSICTGAIATKVGICSASVSQVSTTGRRLSIKALLGR